jgi:ATP/maltotriose-dependent transcriptional regulator MalT
MEQKIVDKLATLTKRRHQIAILVCDGLSNKEIAHELNVSEGTIKCHLHTIFEKLGIQSRGALMIQSRGALMIAVASHRRILGPIHASAH